MSLRRLPLPNASRERERAEAGERGVGDERRERKERGNEMRCSRKSESGRQAGHSQAGRTLAKGKGMCVASFFVLLCSSFAPFCISSLSARIMPACSQVDP